jgi:D-glycero-D-manno-heptose 1,7-bisphosphate phosphatase
MPCNKALFLDRDGTLIEDAHYLKDPNQLKIISGVGAALQKAKNHGYLLFMHTNQSGIARGYYDWPDVHACNARMHQEFGWSDDFFTEVCIAPESPGQISGYRKPCPLFEKEMIEKYELLAADCWIIGDKWIDPQTGLEAGIRGALVRSGKPIGEDVQARASGMDVPIFSDLEEFVKLELRL